MPAEDYLRTHAQAVARRRVRRGIRLLNARLWGWWMYAWAYVSDRTILIPAPGGREEHFLAVVVNMLTRYSFHYSVLRREHGEMNYEQVVKVFKLTPPCLVTHGLASDEVITGEMLDAAWKDALYDNGDLDAEIKKTSRNKVPEQASMRTTLH